MKISRLVLIAAVLLLASCSRQPQHGKIVEVYREIETKSPLSRFVRREVRSA